MLKRDKATSIETFGTYIHQYRYDQAVKDNVVLDLRYEARKVEQNLTSQDKIDRWFEAKKVKNTRFECFLVFFRPQAQ